MSLRQRGGPLTGVRVLELTKVWAGPYAGKLLALLGAEVIKVESRTNLDEMRAYGGVDVDAAPYFLSINQEVLSVEVNMKTQEGLDLLRRMVALSDIVIDNLRPGAMERAGLDHAALRAIRPDIIQLSIKMYGSDGPLGYQTGYAPSFAALGGLTHLVGHAGETPQGMNIRYGDSTVGAMAALAAVAALHHRARTGEGQFVDVSAVEAMSTMVGDSLLASYASGTPATADGNAHADLAPHGCYPCARDEWISLAVGDDAEWRALCGVLAIEPGGFDTTTTRRQRRVDLDAALAGATSWHDAGELAEKLRQAGVPAFKSMSSLDLIGDAFLWESGAYRMVHDAVGDERPVIGPGWKFGRDEAAFEHAAPRLGEHNDYVYGVLLGLSEEELADLKVRRIVY